MDSGKCLTGRYVGPMTNRFHKTSTLSMHIRKGEARSLLEDVRFTAPFKVATPFYDAQDHMRVMTMSVSAGIMAGDRQEIDVTVERGARAEIGSQSFEKIHKMEEGTCAMRETKLHVASGALLIYAPLPTIPFAGSAFENATEITLEDASAQLFFSEIQSCGRAARGERFAYRYYKTLTRVRQGGRLVYSDNCIFDPAQTDMEGFCTFEGYTHLASFLLIGLGDSDEIMEQIRKIIEAIPDCIGGASVLECGAVCIRALANRAETLQSLEQAIKKQTIDT